MKEKLEKSDQTGLKRSCSEKMISDFCQTITKTNKEALHLSFINTKDKREAIILYIDGKFECPFCSLLVKNTF